MRLLALLLLAGCQTTPTVLDKPRTVTVKVPVVQAIDPVLTADCQPTGLAGTTVGALLDRLASAEDCVAKLRAQTQALRLSTPTPAAAP